MANGDIVRILVVDDSEPWRRQVCSMLQTRPEIVVVAEAANGLEAVQKAQELNPDLILLDIGMPILNGIEAAKRIRLLAPDAKIVFLTQDGDSDVAQAAISDGPDGYILKMDVWTELLTTVVAVVGLDDSHSRGIGGSYSDKTETA